MQNIDKFNILYLSYDGMTDPLGQSQVLPYLSLLSEKNNKYYLISFEKFENFSKEKDKIFEICNSNKISWLPLKYTKKPPIFSTLFDLYKLNKKSNEILKQNNIHIVHCRSYITALIGMKLKKKYGIKFVFDMRGFWVDERIEGKIWNIKNPIFYVIYKYFKKLEKKIFSNADYCISLTESGKEEIESWKLYREKKLPIQVIPCCVDLDLFNYENINENIKKKWKDNFNYCNNDFIICYLGSLSSVYKFDKVIDVFKRIRKKNNNAKLLILTKEIDFLIDNFLNFEDNNIVKNINYFSATRIEVSQILSICNLSIFFYLPTYSRKGTSPTRFAELLASGVPIITNSQIGDTDRIVLENNLGYVINDFSDKEIIKIVNEMNFEKYQDKAYLRQIAKKYFDLKNGALKYNEVYNSLFD